MDEKNSRSKLQKNEKSVDEPEDASFACMSLDNNATKSAEPSMQSKSTFGSKQSLKDSQKSDKEKSESSKNKSQK